MHTIDCTFGGGVSCHAALACVSLNEPNVENGPPAAFLDVSLLLSVPSGLADSEVSVKLDDYGFGEL